MYKKKRYCNCNSNFGHIMNKAEFCVDRIYPVPQETCEKCLMVKWVYITPHGRSVQREYEKTLKKGTI